MAVRRFSSPSDRGLAAMPDRHARRFEWPRRLLAFSPFPLALLTLLILLALAAAAA